MLSLLIVGSVIMGATALEDFALALAVGLAVGSYSSIFVASPLLAAWKDRDPKFKVLHDRRRRTTMAAASVATGVPVVETDDDDPREKAVVEAGIPGPPAVGRSEPSRPRTPAPAPASAVANADRAGSLGTISPWQGNSFGSTCATSPTIRSPASSSRTSRHCSPTPRPSAGQSMPSRNRSRTSASTRCSGSRRVASCSRRRSRTNGTAGFVPVRKAGKLPWQIEREEYELEYGTDLLEIHRDAIEPGERVLVVDDVLATGGTASAVVRLVERLGGEVAGLAFLIELEFLAGRKKLPGQDVHAVVCYA